jgi:hypothetical protein
MCHKDHKQNKSNILRYLIPVEMLAGKFPSQKLLMIYNLPEYMEMV